jgi:hypothetical protein
MTFYDDTLDLVIQPHSETEEKTWKFVMTATYGDYTFEEAITLTVKNNFYPSFKSTIPNI